MCELFAVNARRPQVLNAELQTFFGDSIMHPHGWGIATRNANGAVDLRKEPKRAIDSEFLRGILSRPVYASHLLAHIRYATAGVPSYDNCHPFVGTDVTGTQWSFIHNGSIFHQDSLELFTPDEKGTSDSEGVMLYLLDSINCAFFEGARGFDGCFGALAHALASLSFGNKLNVIMDDGTYTYVHTNTEDDSLYCKLGDGVALFCTRPLEGDGWQPLPKCRLLAFRNGMLVRVSEARGGLYHFDEQEMSAFLAAHAA